MLDIMASSFFQIRLRPLFFLCSLVPLALSALTSTPQLQAIEDSYIIALKPDTDTAQFTAHTAWVKQVHTAAIASALSLNSAGDNEGREGKDKIEILTGLEDVFDVAGFKGYSGKFDKATVEEIRKSELGCVSQILTSNHWDLSRISRVTPPGNAPPYQYNYNDGPCICCDSGTWIYVLDTGINICHTDFGGRASFGVKVNDEWTEGDTCGHGTHVAGKAIGSQFGVMKSAHAISVKVLGGSGCTGAVAGVMKGLQWAFEDAREKGRLSCSVVNMSLAVSKRIEALNDLLDSIVARGLTVVVAAGNANPPADACTFSPAGATRAITIGATEADATADIAAFYSNYGSCVNLFAPGTNILSTYNYSCTASAWSTGTSMASPQAAALILYGKCWYCWTNPDQDLAGLVRTFTLPGVIKEVKPGTANLFLHNKGCR